MDQYAYRIRCRHRRLDSLHPIAIVLCKRRRNRIPFRELQQIVVPITDNARRPIRTVPLHTFTTCDSTSPTLRFNPKFAKLLRKALLRRRVQPAGADAGLRAPRATPATLPSGWRGPATARAP